MKLKGVVLAGGKSSRFGEDKALAEWGGQTLLARAVGIFSDLELDPVVISNFRRDYSFLTCPVVNDIIPDKGPLGGLYTACCLFPKTLLLVLTCDMPLVTELHLKQLVASRQNSDQVTVFMDNQYLQPFPGIYSADLKLALQESLRADKLSLQVFLNTVKLGRVVQESSGSNPFQNVNRPEDLKLILAKSGSNSHPYRVTF